MKKVAIFIALFTAVSLSAQRKSANTITLSGKIVDKKTNQPLEYATVVLKEISSQKITGGITDDKGNFSVNTNPGSYEISFEYISFQTVKLPTKNFTQNTNLGVISLQEDAVALDEINIIAEKSTVEIRLDKRIYNVGKDMTVKGGNASDVLDNVPSVNVDVEGNISLRGNENVRILIDGKPSALVGLSGTDALRQLPAEAIERVEVITSPSARYDAEGTAGILNIILRKGKATGFNGSINTTIGDPTQLQIAPNLNFRTEKINLFTNFGYQYRKGPGNSLTELDYLTDGIIDSTRIEKREFRRIRNGFNINLGLEYYLTKNSSITGTVFYRNSDNENNSTNDIRIIDRSDQSETFNDFRIQDEKEDDTTTQFSLNYTNNINKSGHKLTIDLQYSDSKETEAAFITDNAAAENNLTTEHSKNTLIQSDYVLPIGKNSQFEAGYRGDFEDLTSSFLVTRDPPLDFDPSNDLIFKQSINAFYTQYGSKINKFSFLLGLRAEITDVDVNLITSNEDLGFSYTELFPTVNLGLETSEKSSFTLGYSRRLRRPRFWFLNPFESRSSQNVIFKGNPGLIPTFTNSYDLGYLTKIGKLTLNSSVYFQHSTNVIERVSRDEIRVIDGRNEVVTIREPINLASEDRYGFELTAAYNPSRTVKLDGSFNVFQSRVDGTYEYERFELDEDNNIIVTPEIQDLANSNGSWFARFNARILLPWKVQSQTRLFYRGPRQTAQEDTKGIFSANLAFSKDILKDKGTLVLNISDVFNSRKRRSTSFRPNMDEPSSVSYQEFQWRVRQISINFTYRFNQKKNQRSRNRGNQDFESGDGEF